MHCSCEAPCRRPVPTDRLRWMPVLRWLRSRRSQAAPAVVPQPARIRARSQPNAHPEAHWHAAPSGWCCCCSRDRRPPTGRGASRSSPTIYFAASRLRIADPRSRQVWPTTIRAGLFAGVFASNVDLEAGGTGLGGQLYGGYVWRWGTGLSSDLGLVRYFFAGSAELRTNDYTELFAGLSTERFSARLSLTPSYFGSGAPGGYLDLSAARELGSDWTLVAHAGALVTGSATTYGSEYGDTRQLDFRLGLLRRVLGLHRRRECSRRRGPARRLRGWEFALQPESVRSSSSARSETALCGTSARVLPDASRSSRLMNYS